jgi:FixJ family two-component response regulator
MSLAQAFDHQLGLSIANSRPIIFVIDDDISARNSLAALIRCGGWQVETFASAREFIARPRPLVPSCLLLSVSLPDPNSLEVQMQLSRERAEVPIVVISRHADVSMTVQAMKAGAVDFLLSPFSDTVLKGAIRESLEHGRRTLHREMEIRDTRERYESLSRRERQVMKLVVSGLLNKQIGGELGISELTVKAHRGQVMLKMKANSLADLVRLAAKLQSSRHAIHLA